MLYMNYEKPEILHDDRHLGDNANTRQDIKRRIQRTKKRILKWETQERLKLLRLLINDLPDHEIDYLARGSKAKKPMPPGAKCKIAHAAALTISHR